MRFRLLLGTVWFGLVASAAHAAPASALFTQVSTQFRENYGIELVADFETFPVAATDGAIDAQNAGPRNVDMVLYFLRKEFAKYPPELVRQSGLKRIVFCHGLTSHGHRIAGVAVQKNASMYMDSTAEIGDEAHRRRTLHHEFFHFLDYAMRAGEDITHDERWEAANAPGVAYGSAATNQPVSNWASHPAAGFVSDYSLKALPEDRAEIFCALMTNNLTMRLLVQRDKFLAAKVQVLKDELKAFCPQADEAFWTRTAKSF